jgi:hypothetical protein
MMARAGAFEEGEALVRDAIEILAPTDAILFRYGALVDLGEVQKLAGRDVDRAATLADARQLAAAKGSAVMADAADLESAASAEQTL